MATMLLISKRDSSSGPENWTNVARWEPWLNEKTQKDAGISFLGEAVHAPMDVTTTQATRRTPNAVLKSKSPFREKGSISSSSEFMFTTWQWRKYNLRL